MDLTPSDIRSHSFSRSLRGLEASEVEAFLEDVADVVERLLEERDQLEARLEWAKGKLKNVKYVYKKLKRREAHLDERREQLEEETEALERRREETKQERQAVEAEKEELMRVIARLQGAMENELQILDKLRSGAASVSESNGTGGTESAASGTSSTDADEETKEKSTQELINSLFPKRLAPNGPGAASDASDDESKQAAEEEEQGAAAQQFNKIKEDIQGEQAGSESSFTARSTGKETSPSSKASEEDEEVATEEVNQIMGVFDDLGS